MARIGLVGTRIRERRIALGLRQADLAREVGISPSYLNLIEHDRRRIGGKLLIDIARRLDVDVGRLSRGATAALIDGLQAAATRETAGSDVAAVERERAEDFAARLPGWAQLVVGQHERIAALEETVMSLSDRLTHDPFLSESMHEILSSATAIRATASILAETPDIDPEWRERFHDNVFRDSQRLAETSAALLGYFDQMSRERSGFATAPEALTAFAAGHGWHFPEIEAGQPPESIIDGAPILQGASERRLAQAFLERYRADAERMPLAAFGTAARELHHAPGALAAHFGTDLPAVFRRLASLPPSEEHPAFGLVCCDASGTLTLRKPLAAFPVPRFGAACPLWPLYEALGRPAQPLRAVIETPERTRFLAHAICLPAGPSSFDAPRIVEAAMLIQHAGPEAAGSARPEMRPVGMSCRVCPRRRCAARREPSILRPEPEDDPPAVPREVF